MKKIKENQTSEEAPGNDYRRDRFHCAAYIMQCSHHHPASLPPSSHLSEDAERGVAERWLGDGVGDALKHWDHRVHVEAGERLGDQERTHAAGTMQYYSLIIRKLTGRP